MSLKKGEGDGARLRIGKMRKGAMRRGRDAPRSKMRVALLKLHPLKTARNTNAPEKKRGKGGRRGTNGGKNTDSDPSNSPEEKAVSLILKIRGKTSWPQVLRQKKGREC